MKDFQKRLYVERFNLNRKLKKLNIALEENRVPSTAINELKEQSKIMSQYLTILEYRIHKLEESTGEGYNDWDADIELDFGTATELLEEGFVVSRLGWNGKKLVVVKQIPAHITDEIIPKMQSLPTSIKDILIKSTGYIDYTCQNLIINLSTGRADSWVPSVSDMYAKDWIIVNI